MVAKGCGRAIARRAREPDTALAPCPARPAASAIAAGIGERCRKVAATTLWKGWIAVIAEPHAVPEGVGTVGFAIVPRQCTKTFIAGDKRHQRYETRAPGGG
ncbi:hypothetical protein [Lysobacter sp. CA199]|uniref:hypothetical protein n=1 Tax=Lysobacter sp. CA199 TaxID=3455608 RepID=UPI003F8D2072